MRDRDPHRAPIALAPGEAVAPTDDASAGVHLAVPGGRIWMRRVGAGPGLPVVLLHGGPGSPHDYLEPLAALGDERPLVFYDQLGCGRADRPDDPALWTLPRFVDELQAVLDATLAGWDAERVHLYGHSWGAMLAVDCALAHPERIASLVLSSPCLSMRLIREDMARLKAELPESVRRTIERCEAEGTTDSGAYGAAAMAFYRRHVCRMPEWPEPLMRSQTGWNMAVYTTMWGTAEFNPDGNLGDYERMDRLPELSMPVLYLCGRHDEMTPESTEAYRRRTPDAELVVFERSAHVSHLEETEAHLAAVRDFLARAEVRA